MNIEDVEKLAEMARLEMSIEEKQTLLGDMSSILDYVKVIESVELDDVTLVHDLENVWREDVETDRDFSRDSIIAQFPNAHDGFLKVKKIL